MNNIICIKNLNYNSILHNINLEIKRGSWNTIVGPNASGKSTLIKVLSGLISVDSNITIDSIILNNNNIMDIRKNIGVVFDDVDNSFVCETVYDELALILRNLNYNDSYIDSTVKKFSNIFKLDSILFRNAHELSGGEKQRVAIASSLVHYPKVLFLDESLSMLDDINRFEILDILKSFSIQNELTIVSVTHNLDECEYSDNIIVFNKGEVILSGPTKAVLEYDRLLNRLGIEIPFVIDLSLKLKLYGLIDDIYFDMDELVGVLWK